MLSAKLYAESYIALDNETISPGALRERGTAGRDVLSRGGRRSAEREEGALQATTPNATTGGGVERRVGEARSCGYPTWRIWMKPPCQL